MYKNLSKATILLMLAGTVSCFGDKGSSATPTENRGGRRAQGGFGSTLAGLNKNFTLEDFETLVKQGKELRGKLGAKDEALTKSLDALLNMKEDIKEGKKSKERKATMNHLYAVLNAAIRSTSKEADRNLYGEIKMTEAEEKKAKVLVELSAVTKRFLSRNIFKQSVGTLKKVNILTNFMEDVIENEKEIFSTNSITLAKEAKESTLPTLDIDAFEDDKVVTQLITVDERLEVLEKAYNKICESEGHETMKTDYAPEVVEEIAPSFVATLTEQLTKAEEKSTKHSNNIAKSSGKLKDALIKIHKMDPNDLEKEEDKNTLNNLKAKIGEKNALKNASAAKIANSFEVLAKELGVTVDSSTHAKLVEATKITPQLSEKEAIQVLIARYRVVKKVVAENNYVAPTIDDFNGNEEAFKAAEAEFKKNIETAYKKLKEAKILSKDLKKGLSKDILDSTAFIGVKTAIENGKTDSKSNYTAIFTKATALQNALQSYLRGNHSELYGEVK